MILPKFSLTSSLFHHSSRLQEKPSYLEMLSWSLVPSLLYSSVLWYVSTLSFKPVYSKYTGLVFFSKFQENRIGYRLPVIEKTRFKTKQNMISSLYETLFFWQVFGLLTKPLVKHLQPSVKRSSTTAQQISPRSSFQEPLLVNGGSSYIQGPSDYDIDHPISCGMFWNTPSRAVHHYWRKFDNAVMRRIFGGRGVSPVVPGSPIETSVPQWSEEVENKEAEPWLLTWMIFVTCWPPFLAFWTQTQHGPALFFFFFLLYESIFGCGFFLLSGLIFLFLLWRDFLEPVQFFVVCVFGLVVKL